MSEVIHLARTAERESMANMLSGTELRTVYSFLIQCRVMDEDWDEFDELLGKLAERLGPTITRREDRHRLYQISQGRGHVTAALAFI